MAAGMNDTTSHSGPDDESRPSMQDGTGKSKCCFTERTFEPAELRELILSIIAASTGLRSIDCLIAACPDTAQDGTREPGDNGEEKPVNHDDYAERADP